MGPGAAIGAAIGSQLAAAASGRWVAIVFAIYAGCIALKMLRGSAVNWNASRAARVIVALPAPMVGVLIGAFASMAGVGGASLTVPFLLSVRVEMKRALAVSSAVGLAIAVAGAASFATASAGSLSAGSSALFGLVHWPAALMIAASATLFAPGGVFAAQLLPVVHLKRAFAAVLVAACTVSLSKAANTTGLVDYAKASAASTATVAR